MQFGRSLPVLAVTMLISTGVVAQNDRSKMPDGSWVAKPDTEVSVLWSLVEKEKGWATGTRTVTEADGARTVLTTFKISGRDWRCVESFNTARRSLGTECYRLEPR
jgi:hypothetical protein